MNDPTVRDGVRERELAETFGADAEVRTIAGTTTLVVTLDVRDFDRLVRPDLPHWEEW